MKITKEALDKALADMEVRRVALAELYYRQELLFVFWRQALAGRAAWQTVENMTVALIDWLAENRRSFPNFDKHVESYRFLAEIVDYEINMTER